MFTTFYPILSQEWLVHPHLRPYTGEDSSARPQEYWMMWMLHINSAWWFFFGPTKDDFPQKMAGATPRNPPEMVGFATRILRLD